MLVLNWRWGCLNINHLDLDSDEGEDEVGGWVNEIIIFLFWLGLLFRRIIGLVCIWPCDLVWSLGLLRIGESVVLCVRIIIGESVTRNYYYTCMNN